MTYTHHKHKLQGKLRQAQDLAAAEGREVVRLRVERDHWRAKAQSAAADAAVQAPVALREITDDDADAARLAYQMQAPTVSSWAKCIYADNWRRVAQEIRDRLAASLPQWQPIVADDIKPGMLVRGTGDSQPAIPCVELTVLRVAKKALWYSDEWGYLADTRTWEVDPRTVPADPEPDAAAVEAMARAAAVEAMARAVCGDWDALPDSDRDEVRTEMRAALTAYRVHIDGDES